MINTEARVRLLRYLVDARNEATALGFDDVATDIRSLLYRVILAWDAENRAKKEE